MYHFINGPKENKHKNKKNIDQSYKNIITQEMIKPLVSY